MTFIVPYFSSLKIKGEVITLYNPWSCWGFRLSKISAYESNQRDLMRERFQHFAKNRIGSFLTDQRYIRLRTQ